MHMSRCLNNSEMSNSIHEEKKCIAKTTDGD